MATEEKMPSIVLKDGNWPTFSKRFTAFLQIKGLDKCITEAMPTEGVTNERKAQDKQAAGYIMCSVSEKYLNMLEEGASAHQMWTTLKNCFNRQDTARWLDYLGELASLSKKAEESITDYVGRAQDISASLKSIGKPVAEAEVVGHLLRGLPEDYEVWRTVMRSSRTGEGELTFENFLTAMLRAEQSLARLGRQVDSSMTSTAMITKANFSHQHNGFNKRHHEGHQNSQQKCYYCDGAGHFARECPLKAEDEEAAERLRQYKGTRDHSSFKPGVATVAYVAGSKKADNLPRFAVAY